MGYRRNTRGSKKSHHSTDSSGSGHQKPGLWNCLVHHHNKSCNKGDHKCKLSRLTNKCRRLVGRISKEKVVDHRHFQNDIDSLINLYSNNTILFDGDVGSEGTVTKKSDDLIDLINNTSPIHMSRFDSKDRIFDTEGEFVYKTYSCPPRSFDTINTKPTPYKTVIRKQVQSQREHKVGQSKENIVPIQLNHNRRSIPAGGQRAHNSFHQKLNNSRVCKIPTKNSVSPKFNHQRKHMTPPPPPEKPIQCSTKVWDLYEGYDKHVKDKEKIAGFNTIKEPLKNREQDNTFY